MCYTPKEHKWKYQRFDKTNKKRIFVCEKCGKESKSNINIPLEIICKRKNIA